MSDPKPYKPMGYSEPELKERRLKFLRDCNPHLLKELQESGGLDEHLQQRADRCRDRQQDLLRTTHEDQAWLWAVAEVLLETERD